MIPPQTVLNYLADSSQLGGGPNIDFLDGSDQWVVPYDDVRASHVPSNVVNAIFETLGNKRQDVLEDESLPLPVVCSLRSLRSDRDQIAPLLLIVGELSTTGHLTPLVEQSAWVPTCRIATDDYHNQDLVICDMDTYRAHQAALASLPNSGSWSANVERAIGLFESVCSLDQDALNELGLTLETERCVIRPWRHSDDMREASKLLAQVAASLDALDAQDDLTKAISTPLAALLSDDTSLAGNHGDESSLPDDVHMEPKILCGIPDHLPPLGEQDHKALAAIAMRDDDVLALATPKGTNWHVVALAAMANKVTEHALRGDAAPVIACIAPQYDIDEIYRLLGNRPVVGLVALTSRWLPRIDESSNSLDPESSGKRTLGSLASLCLSHVPCTQSVATSNLYLTKAFDRTDKGSAAAYADPWYGPRATTYFLDCVSSFFGRRIHSLREAVSLLAERLRLIDQDRCDLIDAYADVCKAYELHQQRLGIIHTIVELLKKHTNYKERLHFWEQLAKHDPVRHKLLGRAPQSQQKLIEEYALPEEQIALGQTLIVEVCSAYKAEIERVEEQLDRLRGASANLTKRMATTVSSSKRCTQLVSRLRTACGLTIQQGADLTQVIEVRSDEVTLHALDIVLDQTVRPAEFWLALHIYECRWLELCIRHGRHLLRGTDPTTLASWANLCPFGLVNADVAVSALSVYASGGSSGKSPCLDLTLMLRSDFCDIPRGMSVAALSKQLAVFGSLSSLGPEPLRTTTFDELHALHELDEATWHELQNTGLAVSTGRTFYEYVLNNPCTDRSRLSETPYGKPEIESFRSELVPQEPIRVLNQSHEAAIERRPLAGILPEMSYVLVPDSSWTQHGPSKQNKAEARAISRWLKSHAHSIQEEYAPTTARPLVIIAPYAAQAACIRHMLGMSIVDRQEVPWDIRTPNELRNDTWPIVVLCTTCEPTALAGHGTISARTLLSLATSVATDALVLFCGGDWLGSTDPISGGTMRHALHAGKRFSASRRTTLSDSALNLLHSGHTLDLRSTPHSLSAVLSLLVERGYITEAPDVERVTKALVDVGLIELFVTGDNTYGSRPTATGRQIGIVAATNRSGETSCTYSDESVAIIAGLVENLE